jgi:enoyl-CoA hydratase/carnithine racemase
MCTLEKRNNLFILTLTGAEPNDEHRLNPTVISSILSALSQVKSQATRGSVLITTSSPGSKFFSNGFDLAWAQKASADSPNPRAAAAERLVNMTRSFMPIVAALISLPIPTIAAVCGHAAAAGMMLAISHDYVMMRSDKGVLYMSEVDIGLTIPDYFAAMFVAKISSAAARRDVLLGGVKFRGEQAVKLGIVDVAHDSEEKVRDASVRLGEQLAAKKWSVESYAEIRKSLYPELCKILRLSIVSVAIPSPRL